MSIVPDTIHIIVELWIISEGNSFFRDSFLMLSSETIPKGMLYTWRGSTDANFGAKMYITIPRGIFGEC